MNPSSRKTSEMTPVEAKGVLFIGAHPDDIEFHCGGTVYDLRERGAPVSFLVATKGGKGRIGRAGERLKNLRSRHQLDAAEVLGGAGVEMLDYPDKGLREHVESFAADIRAAVERLAPGLIYCWDPDYISNPHPDHQAAADACRIALATANEGVAYYGTTQPSIFVDLDEAAYRAKMRSLRAHRTETPWYYWPVLSAIVRRRLAWGGIRIGARYAEFYRSGP